MKLPLAVTLSFAVACGLQAQTQSTGSTGSTVTTGTSSTGGTQKKTPRITLPSDTPKANASEKATKDAKAGKDAQAAAKATKKAEEPEKIKGIEIPRGTKGFLGIQIVDSTFRLSFYDEKKKPIPADMDRAALRWDPKYKVGEDRVVLTKNEDGKTLSSLKNIRPPYNFKLFITLLKDATDSAPSSTESFTIDFRQ